MRVQVDGYPLPVKVAGHPALEFCNTRAGWGSPVPGWSEYLTTYAAFATWSTYVDLVPAAHPLRASAGGTAPLRASAGGTAPLRASAGGTAPLRASARDAGPRHSAADAGSVPADGEAVLREARTLRAALYAVLQGPEAALRDPAEPDAFTIVRAYAQEAAAAAEFVMGDTGLASWTLPPTLGPRLPLLAVARAAADLLTDPRRHQIGVCDAEGCGWLFLDTRGRRRWCSMASCGNRAKARTYATRHR